MGRTFQYCDDRVLRLEDLREVTKRAEQLAGYRGFSSAQVHDAFFERNTLDIQESLSVLRSAQVGSVVVEGRLKDETPFDDFREVFHNGARTVGETATLAVRVGFEEHNSRQNKRSADTAGVWLIVKAGEVVHWGSGDQAEGD